MINYIKKIDDADYVPRRSSRLLPSRVHSHRKRSNKWNTESRKGYQEIKHFTMKSYMYSVLCMPHSPRGGRVAHAHIIPQTSIHYIHYFFRCLLKYCKSMAFGGDRGGYLDFKLLLSKMGQQNNQDTSDDIFSLSVYYSEVQLQQLFRSSLYF